MAALKIETGLSRKPTWLGSPAAPVSVPVAKPSPKSLGDIAPITVKLSDYPHLAPWFAPGGRLDRKRRKLKTLSGKDAKLILAKNTVAAADAKDNVYVGVEFLEEFGDNDDLVQSILAHEWGHLLSDASKLNVDHLSWEQIFQLRRDEEAAADAFCGRMLAMMGIKPDVISQFLIQAEGASPTLKYYAAEIRAAIIHEAYQIHGSRDGITRKIFAKRVYPNPYVSRLIVSE